jgi:hypothetical protein
MRFFDNLYDNFDRAPKIFGHMFQGFSQQKMQDQ